MNKTALAAPAQITAPAETIVASKLDNSWDKKFLCMLMFGNF